MAIVDSVINRMELYEPEQSSQKNEIQDMFLKILTTQMQYQDPLNPMENTEFTQQLAQLSSVEQLQSVNKNLGYLQLYMASINNSQAIDFIDKEVKASGNSIYWDGSTPPTLPYTLYGDAARVAINVYDQNGMLVDTMQLGEREKGNNSAPWYGTDSTGNTMSPGTYTFSVAASDVNGNPVGATTYMTGPVESISFDEGITYVTVNGQKIAIGDIIEIMTPAPEAAAAGADEPSTAEEVLRTIGGLGKAALKVVPFLL